MEEKILMSIIQNYTSTCVLYTACELSIFDLIEKERLTKTQLIQTLEGNPNVLKILIGVLDIQGLIEEKDGILQNTKLGVRLSERHENSLKNTVLFAGRYCIPSWLRISTAIKNNSYPYKELTKMDFFNDSKDNFEKYTFAGMMNNVSKMVNLEKYLSDNYNKNDEINIVDIGGGTGEIIFKFLQYLPKAKGYILDLEYMREQADEKMCRNNLSNRCQFCCCDFFKNYSCQGEIFILSRVLHDWNDDKARTILKNIKRNMNKNSKLLILEKVVTDDMIQYDMVAALNALHIWTLCGGCERTEQEYRNLLEKEGLNIEKIVALGGECCILEAKIKIEWEETMI